MFSKVGKYSVCFVLFIFIMTLTAEAFTVVRQEELGGDKPMTRSRRKMRQRAAQGQDFESSKSSSSYTIVNDESNNSNNSSSTTSAPTGNFVQATETSTPTPTIDQEAEQEKRDKARKTSNMIVIILVLLVVGGVAGWYFTRNVNFKKMKQ